MSEPLTAARLAHRRTLRGAIHAMAGLTALLGIACMANDRFADSGLLLLITLILELMLWDAP